MRTESNQSGHRPKAGFAIVVVLASLLILTTLFAIASQRSMAHLRTQNAERQLAQRHADHAALLSFVGQLGIDELVSEVVLLPAPFEDEHLRIQDVGGLIDLNTAAPELLEALFATLDFPPDAARHLREWRGEGRQLLRVDDIIRITGADAASLAEVTRVATVFSGRRGVALEIAPVEVEAIVNAAAGIPREALISTPSNANFAIYSDEQLVGTINVSGLDEQPRILELR